jgi:hypothetical protein
VMIPVFAAMLLPVLGAAKGRAQTINCINHEQQLALAIMIYSGYNTNHFPPAATWCDAIKSSVATNAFKCPTADSTAQCDYAFNAALSGMDQADVNPQTVMLFESNGGWDAHGGAELMANPARHEHGRISVVTLANGNVMEVRQYQLKTLRWDP